MTLDELKMRIIIPILLFAASLYAQDFTYSIDLRNTKGFFDRYSADDIPADYSPSMSGIKIDEGGIEPTGCYSLVYSTPIGNNTIQDQWVYNVTAGRTYHIWRSSWTVYYSTGIPIKQGISPDYTLTAIEANNRMYFGDGINNWWKWDAYTVTDCTDIPKGVITSFYFDRLYVVKYNTNELYFSAIGNPEEFDGEAGVGGDDWKYIGRDDGQSVQALVITSEGLVIPKDNSTWILTGSNPQMPNPLYIISPNIGCSSQKSVAPYGDGYNWLSANGLAHCNGKTVTILSEGQTRLFGSIVQLEKAKKVWLTDLAADWNTGTGVNIDTTTTSGDLTMAFPDHTETPGDSLDDEYTIGVNGNKAGTTYIPTDNNIYISSITAYLKVYNTVSINAFAYLYSGSITVPQTFIVCSNTQTVTTTTFTAYTFYFSTGAKVQTGITYWIVFTSTDTSNTGYTYAFEIGESFAKGNVVTYYPAGGWTIEDAEHYGTITTMGYPPAHYTSKKFNASTLWKYWGNFVADGDANDGIINYYIKTGTDTGAVDANSWSQIYTGQPIWSSTGTWIQFLSSMTASVSSDEPPAVHSVSIEYYTSYTTGSVYGCSLDRDYYLICAINENSINNILIKYDKYGAFLPVYNIYLGSLLNYQNSLFGGTSENLGYTYKLYYDNGIYRNGVLAARDSYYETPDLNFGKPNLDKQYKNFYITADRASDTNMQIKYYVDKSTTPIDTVNCDLDEKAGLYNHKFQCPLGTKGRTIRFKFEQNSSSETFKIKQVDIYGDLLPLQ